MSVAKNESEGLKLKIDNYFFVDRDCKVKKMPFDKDKTDKKLADCGNFFMKEEDAKYYADAMKKVFIQNIGVVDFDNLETADKDEDEEWFAL